VGVIALRLAIVAEEEGEGWWPTKGREGGRKGVGGGKDSVQEARGWAALCCCWYWS